MKYLKRFSKVSDYEAFKGGGDYITPNISFIDDGKRVYSEKKVNNEGNLITFPVYLVAGDNGQLGINVYNYLVTNFPKNTNIITIPCLEHNIGQIILNNWGNIDSLVKISTGDGVAFILINDLMSDEEGYSVGIRHDGFVR